MQIDPLIEADEALGVHGAGAAVFLDASWTYPGGPTARAEGVIPGALAFDIDIIADPDTALPHMLPPPSLFAAHMDAFGIGPEDPVIIYDDIGLFAAPRVWWMLRAFGHDHVRLLNGGLPAWIAAGGAVNEHYGTPDPRHGYPARLRPHLRADVTEMTALVDQAGAQILDMRSRDRFEGRGAEPRPGMRSGHMPGAKNLPWTRLLDEDHRLLPAPELAERFAAAGIDPAKPVTTTCGSGVTACLAALALFKLGCEARVYDGSWSEWGRRADLPVRTGG